MRVELIDSIKWIIKFDHSKSLINRLIKLNLNNFTIFYFFISQLQPHCIFFLVNSNYSSNLLKVNVLKT